MTAPSHLSPVTVRATHDLQALLATMKSAQDQRVNMNIWDRDVKTVEDAIATIEECAEIARIIGPSESPIGIPSISLHDLRMLIVNAICALAATGHRAGGGDFTQCEKCWQPATCKKYGCSHAPSHTRPNLCSGAK